MAGPTLATAYVKIEAEVSDVPKQIKEALQQAGADAGKDTGKQLGKDISTGIREGLKAGGSGGTGGTVSGGIGKQIQADITKGLDPKATGTTIGKDISTGVREGMRQGGAGGTTGGIGKQIQEDITKGIDPKATGEKIGKEVGKEVSTGVKDELDVSMKDALEPMRDWAKGVKEEIKKGDIKGALEDAGDVVKNTTEMLSNLGKTIGTDLGGVGKMGDELAAGLDKVGAVVQPVVDRFKTLTDGLKGLRSGEYSQGVRTLGDTFKGLIPDSVLGNLNTAMDTFDATHSTVKDTVDTLGQLKAALGFGGPTAGGVLSVAGAAALPTAAVAALAAAGFFAGQPLWRAAGLNDQFLFQPSYVPAPSTRELLPAERAMQQRAWPAPATEQPPMETPPSIAPMDMPDVPGKPLNLTGAHNVYVPIHGGGESTTHTASAMVEAAQAVVTSTMASISAGSISLGGLSLPSITLPSSPSGAPSSGGKPTTKSWWGSTVPSGGAANTGVPSITDFVPKDEGGPSYQDEFAQLHAGEHVLTAQDVAALGGQDKVAALRAGLSAGGGPSASAPGGGAAAADQGMQGIGDALMSGRTAGFVPAAAGQQTVAGTSSLAGLLNLGNQAVGGLIDAGASAAQMAASAALSAGTFGAGAAASPAAGMGIQMAANEAKRAASYGFQMASIWGDALVEQLFPFGAPRWIGYDYTKYMPQMDIGNIATTTVEKAMLAQQGKAGTPQQQPGGPVSPELMAGMQQGAGPVPKFGEPYKTPAPGAPPPGRADIGTAPGGLGGPAAMQAGLTAGMAGAAPTLQAAPPPTPESMQTSPAPPQQGDAGSIANSFLGGLLPFDDGGWWMPGQAGINTTSRPELVLSPGQLDSLSRGSGGRGQPSVYINSLTAVDADDVSRQIANRQRLAAMQYNSRP
jgi:hypothetical protein